MFLRRLETSQPLNCGLTALAPRFRIVLERLKQARNDRRGSVTLEFALLLPILALFMVGSAEIYSYATATGRVEDAARTIGDLTASNASVDEQRMEAVFKAASAMMTANSSGDNSSEQAEMAISSLLACPCEGGEEGAFCYTVLWSHEYRGANVENGYQPGSLSDLIPPDLAQESNDTFIVSEVTYHYSPKIKMILDDGAMYFNKKLFFRPRQTERVSHTGGQSLQPEPNCSNLDGAFN
ncbi:MAG: pilus assembly protein [Rhodobacteraceae bacterium]|nr:pilus assembly protein [Paracoccaceae bacterium]